MATKIVTKNSSTASAVPTASDLVQGELAVNVADKRLFTEDNAGAIVELGTNPSALTVTGEITANGGIALGDNDKATFGAGDDLQIYHDGSNSYITDTGTGNLYIRASNELALTSAAGESFFLGIADGSSYLYHNGGVKLNTTSTGIDVTGTATMDALDLGATTDAAVVSTTASNYQLQLGAAQSTTGDIGRNISFDAAGTTTAAINSIDNGTSNSQSLGFFTGNSTSLNQRLNIASNGDISFYEDTGTTPKLFWDASAEALGIGTSSPTRPLTVNGNNGTGIIINDAANDKALRFRATGDAFFIEATNNAESAYANIALEGNVGIGTSSPAQKLHISDSAPFARLESTSTSYNGFTTRNDSGNFYFGIDDSGGNFYGSPYARAIYADGAYPVTFYTNATERMRIDSSGNVGIGTSSPDTLIHLSANTGATLTLESTDTAIATNEAIGTIDFFSNDASGIGAASRGSISLIAQDAAGAGSMVFKTSNASSASTERVRIDSSGNVGIGTTSPSVPVHIYKSQASPTIVAKFENPADEAIVEIKSKNTDLGVLQFADTEDANVGAVQYSHSDNSMRFKTNDSERMRIDSSGNLLVGTTSGSLYNTTSNTGIQLDGTNANISVARSNNRPMDLNRLGSDGDIVQLRKDGTTVGSIGNKGGSVYYSGSSTGVYFGTNDVVPTDGSGSFADNAKDLGTSSYRWKDLYLSGGVYLGGTGGANKLDDYEEGTFTPSFSMASGSVTYGTREAAYTKIGNTVTATVALSVASISSPSGNLTVTGFPFAAGSGERYVSSITVGIARDFTVDFASGIKGYMTSGNTNIQIAINAENAGHSAVNANTLKVGTRFYFTITYQTA